MKKTFLFALLAFSTALIFLAGGCTPAATPVPLELSQTGAPQTNLAPPEPADNEHLTIPEVEKLAGFDVKEPTYLPPGVSFEYATYQKSPSPAVTLHFKIVHETYGDMGAFFQIMQEPRAATPNDAVSCGETGNGCEVLQIGGVPVVYRLNPAGPEGLDWYANGFVFRLLRTAGEPNKTYKDELLKVAGSMK
jgi:hypothetical protein